MPERFTSVVDAHVVLRRDGKILLVRRAGNVYASGQLCLPSGHLEQGESILDAAIRETKEEVGILLDPVRLRLVLSIHQRNRDKKHTRLGFVFEPEEWANPDNLPTDTVDYTAAALRAIQRGTTFALNGW